MSKTVSRSGRFIRLLASERFFWFIVGALVLQAGWIALSGRYPMAFDEDFHLGVIRLYAHHISPFWGNQPAGADVYGAVARDPSYMYQWLMSFPYRLITIFTKDQTIIVLWLRAVNIALFATALPLFRKLLLKTKVSRPLVHVCMLLFVLIPIVPLLAAQINYDNLMLPLVALGWLLLAQFSENLVPDKPVDTSLLLIMLSLGLIASLVKYPVLPLFVVMLLFLIVRLYRTYPTWHKVVLNLRSGWRLMSRPAKWLLSLLLIGTLALFGERYVINAIRYHEPIPDCSQVLTIKQCSAYGPWIRDYNFHIAKVNGPRSPITFTADWFYGMWLRSFFAVDGPGTQFQTRGPLIVPGFAGIALAVAGVLLLIRYAGRLVGGPQAHLWQLLLVSALFYIALLWLDEYRAFLRTGQPVAINGRYLLPVVLPLMVASASALRLAIKSPKLKLVLASTAVLCFSWGGGALTYVLRSNDAWYWSNQTIRQVDHVTQALLGPITPGYYQQTQFLR